MKGSVNFGGIEVEVVANAASPYLYKSVFREDFLAKVQETNPDVDLFVKMGYIMANQAKMGFREIRNLTEEDFFEWLEGFGAMDIMNATQELADVYFAQAKGTAAPKAEAE